MLHSSLNHDSDDFFSSDWDALFGNVGILHCRDYFSATGEHLQQLLPTLEAAASILFESPDGVSNLIYFANDQIVDILQTCVAFAIQNISGQIYFSRLMKL